uniref:Uncharacterized protein n=1 Tax=Zea mays TaxID=4577 RepID=B4FZ45_MAIZE|nr:unknown [Zea mays]
MTPTKPTRVSSVRAPCTPSYCHLQLILWHVLTPKKDTASTWIFSFNCMQAWSTSCRGRSSTRCRRRSSGCGTRTRTRSSQACGRARTWRGCWRRRSWTTWPPRSASSGAPGRWTAATACRWAPPRSWCPRRPTPPQPCAPTWSGSETTGTASPRRSSAPLGPTSRRPPRSTRARPTTGSATARASRWTSCRTR